MTKDLTTGKIMPILVKFSTGFRKSVPADVQCSRQHYCRTFCRKRGTGSGWYLQPDHNTYDLILKWSVHGSCYFNGNAVWSKRL